MATMDTKDTKQLWKAFVIVVIFAGIAIGSSNLIGEDLFDGFDALRPLRSS
jgi:hypothetical protein